MNQSTALALAPETGELIATTVIDPAEYFQPVASVAVVMERQKQLAEIVSSYLIPAKTDQWGNVNMEGADYGLLPGTKTRTLFQPGAEKLALVFGLTVTAYCENKQEDWTAGFFRYTFKATASFKGQVIRETTRTCHTREKKYAWIWVNRPKPDQATIDEMIELQTGRWGTKWEKQNGRNVKQTVWQERKENPDPFSLQFVVEAMAQKRAKVAVVKEALAATGYFATETDWEDFAGEVIEAEPVKPEQSSAAIRNQHNRASAKEDRGSMVSDQTPDEEGADRFWKAVTASGIQKADAKPIADRAIKGEITWQEAIDELPEA